uniref:Laminin subunit alpha 3 n=2 Tax=Elapinae TaxID=42168 RepID=A0A8C6XWT5_NAJNA
MARTRVAAVLLTSRTPPGAALAGIVLALWSCCHPVGSLSTSSLGAGERALSLHPPYFNLAETTRIWATATCGQDESGRPRLELFCKLVGGPAASPAGQTIQGQFCDYCNAADPNKAHPIDYAIDGTERWWQSPSLSLGLKYDEVNVTLDLGQLFHVAYVLIKFANSPRPDLWVLERSIDFGRTYTPWQYFAYSKADCWERFRKEANSPLRKDNDVICTTEYSRIVPLENGEIVISLVNGRPGANNFSHSSILREFTQATNIRLHFLRTNTLLGHLISKAQRDPTVTRRYYYSLKDISIGGQCVCHGHADVYQCECQHNTCGETCDRCCPGYNQKIWQPATASSTNVCEPCNCHGHALDCYYDHEVERRKESLNLHGQYQGGGVCIDCQHNTAGINCEKCLKGYYRLYGVPITAMHGCIPCRCSPEHSNGCEEGSGRCYCQLNYQGETCDRCADGYHSFPFCYREYHTCQCSTYGSYQDTCHPTSGQCDCRPGFIGQQCDRCISTSSTFPHCQGVIDECDPAGTRDSYSGYCLCLQNVEGPTCSICKPLYWNLASANPYGCIDCQCDVAGVLSGIRECQQLAGECYCKPNVCGGPCDTCEAGYHGLETKNYFGCQGCKCDVGGSVSHVCNDLTGDCQCRSHIIGKTCTEPEKNYYLPDLHHMKFEIEDGTSPNGRGVRFGYNSQEFPGFSWRGYVQMSSIQNEVRITLSVKKPKPYLFHVILRYINPGTAIVSGHITAYQSRTLKGTDQSKDIFFPLSREPAFVTVPGKSFADSFLLGPGTWMFKIMAEGVLLDYLVLLPSDYYEASILEFPVVQPCTYSGYVITDNCLQYEYLPVDKYRCVFGTDVTFFLHRGQYRKTTFQQPTVKHPVMSHINGQEVNLQIKLKVPQVGRYAILFEYVTVYDLMYVGNIKTESLEQVMENQITLNGRVPHIGRYVFIIHFYQPENPTFPVQVLVDGGQLWSGSYNASFCPHTSGCRSLIISENHIEFDILKHDISVTMKIPNERTMVLEHILVVPAHSYSYTLLHKDSVIRSIDFISQCGGNSFHIVPGNSSEFCRNSARSLVAAFNDGALPCNCHRKGATSATCNPDGGQCNCRAHIIGRQCIRCQTGYYGFPFCKPCSCGRRLCDDITGKCICPPQTVKPRCEACMRLHFGYHPLTGCEKCNCSSKGVTSAMNPECNKIDGQCRYVTGRQCDHCAPGSYGFPNCKPCKCNRGGTEQDICNPQTGLCLCKENVEGVQCDMCRSGSFYLDPANPKGCTTCFCFGATNICHSTNKHRVKFTDMRNWHLEAVGNAMNIPTTFNPISNSVVADVQELPPFLHNLYWVAPSSYLGNKLSSYGGYLSYQLKSFGLPSEGMTLLEKRPDVQLIGREMKITYIDPNNPLPDKLYYGSVQLVEENFRHTSSNHLVSREELMMVLSRLDGLQIRGLYFTETQRLTLGDVGLEEATNTGNGNIAYAVEACSCPPEYMGDSCQECSPGFYRESVGQFTGRCVLCNCNGNSDRCLDGSGICINCQHNTAGEKCERCKEGYFRDASQGLCKECHCPYTNSFASGCLEVNGEIQCFCKEGYSGKHCESCAPGYFGNPLKYRYCQKCNCLENGQLTKCDRLTGECISQEPKDIDPNEDCNSCGSCVITLLEDLSTMGSELRVIEFQMQSINTSAQLLGQMKHLEVRSKQLESLLDHSRSVVKTQSSKVDELETGLSHLNQNINALKEKVSFKNLYILLSFLIYSNYVFLVLVLLGQIDGTSTEGNSLPIKHSAKELVQAQQMINEMRNRNFGQQLTEAEKEKGKAQHLLDRIRNELEKRKANNQGLIKSVRDSLNEYESKLNDLHESLREAKEQTKLAENLNGENKHLLEAIKKQTEEMTKQQNAMWDLLNSAKASVSQTSSIFELFQKSKEEYESLAANLDGAKKDLDEKLKSQFLSSSKEPLVVKAEMYANSLQDLARKLDEYKNASKNELATCTTFENISDIIRAAEAAANKALSAADSASSIVDEKDLPGMAERLKTNSGKVLNKAQETQKTLQDLSPALDDMRNKLQEAERKKTAIQGNLSEFQNNLQGVKRGNLITIANTMIKNANNITTNVLSELDPIKAGVENIKNTYENIQITDFNKALTEASRSVNNLTSMLPDLFNKITNINQQVISTSNITENINRIRELIQKARDAANKVAIPMKFNGKSGVEVRLPDILDDLKGYTSLSFFLQRPDKKEHMAQPQTRNMFLMYLGNKDGSSNYIGMAIRGGHLICAYNLGGSENKIRVTEKLYEKNTRDIALDQVTFKRIYQYAELEYKHAAPSDLSAKYEPQDSSRNSNTLLNLDPDKVVFYVGGYPPEFTPPSELDYPPYEGCVELDSLNDRVFSLYNFKETFNLNTTVVQPCRRYREQSDEFYFEGIGYAHIKVSSDSANIRYEQTIQTTSDVGLVFFAENQVINIHVNVSRQSGKWGRRGRKKIRHRERMIHTDKLLYAIVNTFHFNSYYLGGIPTTLRERRFNISTPPFRGCMKNIKTSFERSISFSESFGVSRKCPDDWKLMRTANFFKNGVLDLSDEDFPFPDNFQVGFGFHTLAVNGMLLSYNIRVRKVNYLLLSFKIQSNWFPTNAKSQYLKNVSVSFSSFQLADFTIFLRNGYVIVSLADEEIQSSKKSFSFSAFSDSYFYMFVYSRSHFAVDVRTSSSRGMVFFMADQMGNRYVALYLSKGRYVLAVAYDGKKIKIKSKAKYSDGQWHMVAFSISENKIRLIIDGLKTHEGNLPSSYPYSQINASIYLGAVQSLNIQKSFVGCLRNFQVGRKHMYTYQKNNGVLPCLDNILENGVSFFNEGGYIVIGEYNRRIYLSYFIQIYVDKNIITVIFNNIQLFIHCIFNQFLCFVFTVNLETPWLPIQDVFLGCLKNMKINDKSILLNKMSNIHGVVSLEGCPVY